MREKFERRSEDSLACTAVVIDASSMLCPAVFPVVDWQPTRVIMATAKIKCVSCLIMMTVPF
jgi:hypothetical protein